MKEDDYDFEGSVEAPTASDMKRFTSEYWPLHFLGQFNFADSRDLAGDLPGDVLLLFGSFDGHDLLSYWEWHSLDLGDRMTEADVPPLVPEYPSDKELPCHGQILRTCDFVDFDYDNLKLEGLDFGDRREIERLFFWEATRIGGAPFCCQRPTDWTPGRFLCALSGLHSSDSTIYIHLDAEGRLHWDDQCT